MYIFQGKEYETLNDLWDAAQPDNSYNGWTNRETWLVNLWFLDHLYTEIKHLDSDGDRAHYIKEHVEQYMDDMEIPNGFISDLIDISQVNWHELANVHVIPSADES